MARSAKGGFSKSRFKKSKGKKGQKRESLLIVREPDKIRYIKDTDSMYVCDTCFAEVDSDDIEYNGESVGGLQAPSGEHKPPNCPYCGNQLTYNLNSDYNLNNDRNMSRYTENTLDAIIQRLDL